MKPPSAAPGAGSESGPGAIDNSTSAPGDAWVAEVRAAAARLAERLRFRHCLAADLAHASPRLPAWWLSGLASEPVFGEGLLALPAREPGSFSRPVVFLTPAEISLTAGGEAVPLAWVDGGAYVAVVLDRGERPVVVTAPDASRHQPEAAEQVASSLIAFLDALVPQTVCRFIGAGGASATMELVSERSLLIERNGALSQRDFADDDGLGEYVATFIADALDAGMGVLTCPARLRSIVDAYAPARASIPPEVRAQAAIERLLEHGELELAGPPEADELPAILEDLIDEAGRFLEKNRGARDMARSFAEWLSQHRLVEDVYADDDTVRAALASAEPEEDPAIA